MEGHEERWAQQAEMLANRLCKKQRHLGKWARRRGITCFRVYHRDIPEIPLSIDWYHDKLYVAEWSKRHRHPEELHPLWQEWMLESVCEALEIDRSDVYLKLREKQKGKQQYEKLDAQQQRMWVEEGGLRFGVNLTDYLDTGLFLDHRQTRAMVREEAEGGRFLNLFAYTGSFSVYAADGGATHTTTVDMSKTYLGWAHENMQANGFEGREHRYFHSDVFAFLKEPERDKERYDLIVLDPPTFSASKRMQGNFDIQRDQVFLIRRTLELLQPGGILYFSTNFRKFELHERTTQGYLCEEITHKTLPEDFRNTQIHRCWRICAPLDGEGQG